jgi:hypothetical protein
VCRRVFESMWHFKHESVLELSHQLRHARQNHRCVDGRLVLDRIDFAGDRRADVLDFAVRIGAWSLTLVSIDGRMYRNLRENRLEGTLPTELGKLTSLRFA